MAKPVTCPFCGHSDSTEYAIQYHIEEHHTEDSPFIVKEASPPAASPSNASSNHSRGSVNESMPVDMWTRCTRPNCGEYVLLSEIDEHLELHEAVVHAAEEEEQPPMLPPRRHRRPSLASSSSPALTVQNVRKLEKRDPRRPGSSRASPSLFSSLFSGASTHSRSTVRRIHEPRDPGRLGKRELGPFAFEKRMPDEVRRSLINDAKPTRMQKIGRDGRLVKKALFTNETPGLIPILADLCALDEDNEAAYLCHPSTKHVRKLYCDGNFCGYWSIQMVLSYVQHIDKEGPQELPNVIEMQDLIEEAWDRGICSYSEVETGGLRNTRKWIGTTEAVAFFTRIGVKAEALCIGGGETQEKDRGAAAEELLDYVEAYFMSGIDSASTHGASRITQLPPIYFQRMGHSMVIVGLEREYDGMRNLLVFDSSWATSEPARRLLDGRRTHTSPHSVLRPYRRSHASLSRWSEFEVLVPQMGILDRKSGKPEQ